MSFSNIIYKFLIFCNKTKNFTVKVKRWDYDLKMVIERYYHKQIKYEAKKFNK